MFGCESDVCVFSMSWEGTVTCVGRLVDVLDKKSGAVVLVDGRSAGREQRRFNRVKRSNNYDRKNSDHVPIII